MYEWVDIPKKLKSSLPPGPALVAQWIARHPPKVEIEGLIPSTNTCLTMPSICDERGEGMLGLLAGRGGLLAGGGGRLALKGTWSNAEDEMLLRHHETFGDKWAKIATAMANGRTGQQCLIRYKNQLQPGISNKPWSEDEDRRLIALRTTGGSWPSIAIALNSGRTAKQCQERWTNLLDPVADRRRLELGRRRNFVAKTQRPKWSVLSNSRLAAWPQCQRLLAPLHSSASSISSQKKPICIHNVPVRRCLPCNGYDICVHRVNRNWCHKCCGARWRRAVIEKRMQFMMHNSASDLLARVTKMFAMK